MAFDYATFERERQLRDRQVVLVMVHLLSFNAQGAIYYVLGNDMSQQMTAMHGESVGLIFLEIFESLAGGIALVVAEAVLFALIFRGPRAIVWPGLVEHFGWVTRRAAIALALPPLYALSFYAPGTQVWIALCAGVWGLLLFATCYNFYLILREFLIRDMRAEVERRAEEMGQQAN